MRHVAIRPHGMAAALASAQLGPGGVPGRTAGGGGLRPRARSRRGWPDGWRGMEAGEVCFALRRLPDG
eukprot:11154516-Lingulodinium_polyedra.AAC.1